MNNLGLNKKRMWIEIVDFDKSSDENDKVESEVSIF